MAFAKRSRATHTHSTTGPWMLSCMAPLSPTPTRLFLLTTHNDLWKWLSFFVFFFFFCFFFVIIAAAGPFK
jgi:hypothetical protein